MTIVTGVTRGTDRDSTGSAIFPAKRPRDGKSLIFFGGETVDARGTLVQSESDSSNPFAH